MTAPCPGVETIPTEDGPEYPACLCPRCTTPSDRKWQLTAQP